jgi:hypothetical protein
MQLLAAAIKIEQHLLLDKHSYTCLLYHLIALCQLRAVTVTAAATGGVSERVVNQLLTEMDGLEERRCITSTT